MAPYYGECVMAFRLKIVMMTEWHAYPPRLPWTAQTREAPWTPASAERHTPGWDPCSCPASRWYCTAPVNTKRNSVQPILFIIISLKRSVLYFTFNFWKCFAFQERSHGIVTAPRRQHHSADRCVAESTTRLLSSVIKLSNCNNLRILLVYSRHTDSRVFWGHLRQTYRYFQHSLHRQTLLLVGSHAVPHRLDFGTVFICTHCWQFH